MALAPTTVCRDTGDGTLLGIFAEKEFGYMFEYSTRTEDLDVFEGYPHKVWMNGACKHDSGFRYANVKKTVAYVVINEDDEGKPVAEKWIIKAHQEYPTK
jgi:hypothetical protein